MFRRLGRSFYFNSFNPHSEPARKLPLHRRGSESLSFKFIQLCRDRGVPKEPSSLPSNPRLHLPLKSPRFPGSERFFPDPTGGCFCHSGMLGGVQGVSRPEEPADTLRGWDLCRYNTQVWVSKAAISLFASRKQPCWNPSLFIGSLRFPSTIFSVYLSQWCEGLLLTGL